MDANSLISLNMINYTYIICEMDNVIVKQVKVLPYDNVTKLYDVMKRKVDEKAYMNSVIDEYADFEMLVLVETVKSHYLKIYNDVHSDIISSLKLGLDIKTTMAIISESNKERMKDILANRLAHHKNKDFVKLLDTYNTNSKIMNLYYQDDMDEHITTHLLYLNMCLTPNSDILIYDKNDKKAFEVFDNYRLLTLCYAKLLIKKECINKIEKIFADINGVQSQ